MTYSSSLDKDLRPIVLDTSVLINIHASSHGKSILNSLPNNVLVPDLVASELCYEIGKTDGAYEFTQDLAASGDIDLITMGTEELEIYSSLVSGDHSLDDGESATIAIAATQQCIPVIDERKGRRQAKIRCPSALPAWSVDLLCHPEVINALGSDHSRDAIYLALREGRMRIHEDHCDYVVGLISPQRAIECNSLPRYNARRLEWQSISDIKEQYGNETPSP